MTEVPAQTTDSTTEVPAQAEITPVTAAAPAVDNATLTSDNVQIAPLQQAEGGATGEGVDDKSDYKARKAAFLSNPNAPVAAPAPVVAPVVAETPAKPAPVNQDDAEDAPLIVDGTMPKMRVRTVTPVDVQAVAEFQASQKAGNKQSLVEFIAERFVPKLPVAAEAATQATADTTTTPQTLEQVTAELARLEAERDSLQEDFEFERAKELKPKLAELRQKERELLLQSVASTSDQAQEQAAAEEPFLIRAAQMFPQSAQADSAL
ncbi:MAG: hypothetical protein J0L73_26390, partial [Verrucomicrobia bacterium]|nr:hypothetical protein [Verrucomicrobiota bacterium]